MAQSDLGNPHLRAALDPQRLTHFLAVYDSGTFSGAAMQNGVSQQAVSKSVARLEEALGVPLFERSSYGASPTRFADQLAKRALAIVAEGKLAAAELAAMRGSGRGSLRIGLGWSFLTRIGPDVLRRFKDRHPDVMLTIVSGDSAALYRKLLAGDVELVASAPTDSLPVDPGIHRQPLFIERDMLTLRADHPLAIGGPVPLEELARQTWCISMQLQQQWERVCEIFLSHGVEPPTNIIDLDSIMLVKSVILTGDGVGLLAPELFAADYERERFALVAETPFTNERTAYLASRKGSELQSHARYLREIFHQSWRSLVPQDRHLA